MMDFDDSDENEHDVAMIMMTMIETGIVMMIMTNDGIT